MFTPSFHLLPVSEINSASRLCVKASDYTSSVFLPCAVYYSLSSLFEMPPRGLGEIMTLANTLELKNYRM